MISCNVVDVVGFGQVYGIQGVVLEYMVNGEVFDSYKSYFLGQAVEDVRLMDTVWCVVGFIWFYLVFGCIGILGVIVVFRVGILDLFKRKKEIIYGFYYNYFFKNCFFQLKFFFNVLLLN